MGQFVNPIQVMRVYRNDACTNQQANLIKMKSFSFLFTLLFVASAAFGQDNMQMVNSNELAPGTFVTFHAPVDQFIIKIQSENGIVTTLEIPKGVFFSIQATEKSNPDRSEEAYPKMYKGDIVIRTRRADEVGENEGRGAWEMMQLSPFQLALENVTVIVEKY